MTDSFHCYRFNLCSLIFNYLPETYEIENMCSPRQVFLLALLSAASLVPEQCETHSGDLANT